MFGLEELFNSLIRNPENKTAMRADIIERDTTYEVRLDVPGFTKDEIDISLKDGYLIIKAEKEDKTEEDTVLKERHTSLYRTFYLDGKVDVNTISAELNNGVLIISAKKAEERQPKSISIDVK